MLKSLRTALSVAAAAVGIFSSPAFASSADYGYISAVLGTNNGAVLFNTSGTRTTLPSCQGPGLGQRFAIDASTTAGQAAVSVFLLAYAQHKRIFIQGLGTCSIWGDTETVVFFSVED